MERQRCAFADCGNDAVVVHDSWFVCAMHRDQMVRISERVRR